MNKIKEHPWGSNIKKNFALDILYLTVNHMMMSKSDFELPVNQTTMNKLDFGVDIRIWFLTPNHPGSQNIHTMFCTFWTKAELFVKITWHFKLIPDFLRLKRIISIVQAGQAHLNVWVRWNFVPTRENITQWYWKGINIWTFAKSLKGLFLPCKNVSFRLHFAPLLLFWLPFLCPTIFDHQFYDCLISCLFKLI